MPDLNQFSPATFNDICAFFRHVASKMPHHGIVRLDSKGKATNESVQFGSATAPSTLKKHIKEHQLVLKRKELYNAYVSFCEQTKLEVVDLETMIGHVSQMQRPFIVVHLTVVIIDVINFCKEFDPDRFNLLNEEEKKHARRRELLLAAIKWHDKEAQRHQDKASKLRSDLVKRPPTEALYRSLP